MPAGTVPPLSFLPAMPKPRWGKPPATPRRGRWSTEEVARLRELYGHRTDASIGRELGRTAQAVRRTADTLFEGQELRTDPWTEADLELLRECLGASDLTALCRVLARGQQDVQDKIAELAQLRRSRPFTLEEVALFKRIYGSRTDEDLAIVFGRPAADIAALGARLCLAKDKASCRKAGKLASKMPRWSGEELDVLRELYPHPEPRDRQASGALGQERRQQGPRPGLEEEPRSLARDGASERGPAAPARRALLRRARAHHRRSALRAQAPSWSSTTPVTRTTAFRSSRCPSRR